MSAKQSVNYLSLYSLQFIIMVQFGYTKNTGEKMYTTYYYAEASALIKENRIFFTSFQFYYIISFNTLTAIHKVHYLYLYYFYANSYY